MYARPWGTTRRSRRRDLGLGMYNPHLFLAPGAAAPARHRPAWPLAGTGVSPSPLAVHRQTPPVPQPPVRTDLNEAADVLVDLPAQVAFGHILTVNYFPNAVY